MTACISATTGDLVGLRTDWLPTDVWKGFRDRSAPACHLGRCNKANVARWCVAAADITILAFPVCSAPQYRCCRRLSRPTSCRWRRGFIHDPRANRRGCRRSRAMALTGTGWSTAAAILYARDSAAWSAQPVCVRPTSVQLGHAPLLLVAAHEKRVLRLAVS